MFPQLCHRAQIPYSGCTYLNTSIFRVYIISHLNRRRPKYPRSGGEHSPSKPVSFGAQPSKEASHSWRCYHTTQERQPNRCHAADIITISWYWQRMLHRHLTGGVIVAAAMNLVVLQTPISSHCIDAPNPVVPQIFGGKAASKRKPSRRPLDVVFAHLARCARLSQTPNYLQRSLEVGAEAQPAARRYHRCCTPTLAHR